MTCLWRPRARSARGKCARLVACGILALTCATLAAQNAALDYPQWRGRDRDGSASAFIEPLTWPRALNRRWRLDVGEGYSTPIVVGDALYVFTRQDGNEVLAALDAATGNSRWRTSYPATYTPGQPAAAHGAGPKATPLFHDGKLFTLGISGIVSAFEATTGKLVWQTSPPPEAPFYGAASSPVGEGELVFVHPGDYGPLTAFDVRTGERRWTTGSGGFFASPIVVTLSGVRQVVTATQDGVIGVSLDGRVLWRHTLISREGSTTPVLADDVIVVGTGREGTIGLRPALRNGEWTVDTIWTAETITLYTSDPVVAGGTVFGLSTRDKGQFFALDVVTGRTLWLGPPREADHTAIVKGGGVKGGELLFLLNDDAELIVARASRAGFEPVARYTVAESATWAQPLLSGNRVFIKDVASLALWTWD